MNNGLALSRIYATNNGLALTLTLSPKERGLPFPALENHHPPVTRLNADEIFSLPGGEGRGEASILFH